MVPLLEPDALTTLLTLKNDISSAVPTAPGRMPVVVPDAEAATTLAVKPVLVRSTSVKFTAIVVVSGEIDSVWSACSVTVAATDVAITGLSSVPVTVIVTVCCAVPP